jgi:hypothetical protein
MSAVRKQVYLDASQERRIKRRAEAEGVPDAVVIRRALDAGLDRLADLQRPELTATSCRDRVLDTIDRMIAAGPVAGRRRWRRDEIYDRDGR